MKITEAKNKELTLYGIFTAPITGQRNDSLKVCENCFDSLQQNCAMHCPLSEVSLMHMTRRKVTI